MCELIGKDPNQLTMISETSLSAVSVRPDYAVEYNGALVGFSVGVAGSRRARHYAAS
jgi:hypothetical protein